MKIGKGNAVLNDLGVPVPPHLVRCKHCGADRNATEARCLVCGGATRIRYELRLLSEPPVTHILGTFDIDATPQLNWPLIPVGVRWELVKVPLP